MPEGLVSKLTDAEVRRSGGVFAVDQGMTTERRCGSFYLCTFASPPWASFSTSGSVAMLVSPGVLMARAPWATPRSERELWCRAR